MEDELHMKLVLYTISVMTVVAWALCYFVYSYNGTVHLLLLMAVLIGAVAVFKKH